ncbi:hypothetical protein ABLW17_01590 [Anaerococcus murdochii]|uniref:hypothetical protein n=1 Tax=Anaerococcus murdochii TaxID=411577 RepID=UPI00280C22CF|nr:hypothetical protein [uncultured Anaerococcus sp.]
MKDRIIKIKENLTYYIKSLSFTSSYIDDQKMYKSTDWEKEVKILPMGAKVLMVILLIFLLIIL